MSLQQEVASQRLAIIMTRGVVAEDDVPRQKTKEGNVLLARIIGTPNEVAEMIGRERRPGIMPQCI